MKDPIKVNILLEIELSGPVEDLLDKVAGRIYIMDKVEDVRAEMLVQQDRATAESI